MKKIIWILIALIIGVVVIGAISNNSKDQKISSSLPEVTNPSPVAETPVPVALRSRSFQMGFVPIPPQPLSVENWNKAFEVFSKSAEVLMQHVHFSSGDLDSLKFIDAMTNRSGLQLFVVLDPLAADRLSLDSDLAAKGKSFADSAVRSAYQNRAQAIARDYQPHYLSLGSEINTYLTKNPDDAPNLISLINETIPLVKRASPRSVITTSFQYEELTGKTGPSEWATLKDFPNLDAIAFTTYPSPFFKSAAEIPADYYRQIKQYTSKPLLIAESGWPTEGQADFVSRLAQVAEELKVEVWIWWFPYDWAGPGYAEVFKSMGLRESNGESKPGWQAWTSIYTLPR